MTQPGNRVTTALEEAGGLVSRAGLARRWGVSRQRIAQLADNRERNGFPEPLEVDGGPPVYLANEVEAWWRERTQ
jgi:hypothetical protein